MLSGTALHMHGTASPGLTMDSAFGESSAKRALSFTECFAAPSEAETKTPRTLLDSENGDDTLGRPGHAVQTSRVCFDSAAANGPASAAPAGPAPQKSPLRAEDGDDAGYNYVAAKDFLNIHRLSQPPHLPRRVDDSGDLCYKFYKIFTNKTLPPGSLWPARPPQPGRVEYKRAKMLYSKHPHVISEKQKSQVGRQLESRKKKQKA